MSTKESCDSKPAASDICPPQSFKNEFHKFISGKQKAEGQSYSAKSDPKQAASSTSSSASASISTTSTTITTDVDTKPPTTAATTKSCSVKLVDIGPKTTPAIAAVINSNSSDTTNTSDDSNGDSSSREETLKRELPPHSLETSEDSDEPNAKRVRPAGGGGGIANDVSAGRVLLKPKDFIDLKKRTVGSSSLDNARLKPKPNGNGGTVDHKSSTSSAFDNVEEELGRMFGASSPQKKDSNSGNNSGSKVTISPVKSSSSTTKDQPGGESSSNKTSSGERTGMSSSSATSTTSTTSTSAVSTSSSSGSVTITKLSTGSSLSVESKDLKTILSSSGSGRNLSISSSSSSSKSGNVENGFKMKKNVDIVPLSTNSKPEQLSPTDNVIKCNKCNEEYSTKEARRLHTCNSILDQHYLSVDNPEQRSNQKTSSPSSPQLSSSSATVNDHHGRSSSPPSSFDSASSRSSSPMMEHHQQWGGSSKKGQPHHPSSASVKLIQENSEKLIIEGRPKLSVTKVSRMENSNETPPKSKYSQSGSGSPTVPKLKLSTSNSSSDSKKSSMSSDLQDGKNSPSVSKARWSTAMDNSYNGKLKIKLQPEKPIDKNNSSSSSRNDATTGPEGGMPFAFAGKPTYSPSRIEPSNSNGTVQTKGMSKDLMILFSYNPHFQSIIHGSVEK